MNALEVEVLKTANRSDSLERFIVHNFLSSNIWAYIWYGKKRSLPWVTWASNVKVFVPNIRSKQYSTLLPKKHKNEPCMLHILTLRQYLVHIGGGGVSKFVLY
jgi:hypothetical protein